MLRWDLGDVSVVRIVEMLPLEPAKRLLRSATDERLDAHRSWLYPHFLDDAGNLKLSIHALVIESAGRTILVDTCVGNDKERGYRGMAHLRTPFLEQLEGAGYPPGSIDTVLCTHLHFDHVGWNTTFQDGQWVPTFPGARYLFAEREWEFWREQEAKGADARFDSWQVISDSVRPVLDAGLVDLVPLDHQLTEEVWLEPTPGHTPGHVSVRISSKGQDAVITGDMVHNPVQFGEPEWSANADNDRDQAIATRRAFLGRYGGTGTVVLGTHFPAPTAGRIVADGAGWRFETAGS